MSLLVDIRLALGAFALDVQFEAPDGVTVLFGRSGAGKTSVIRAVAGLVRPDAGRIAVGDRVLFDAGKGVNVPVHHRHLGYVFQEGRLFPHLTVRANLAYGARMRGAAPDNLQQIVDLLGIGALLDRRPGALSGGEAQRVAIGRALLSNPDMLLMDEPLASLDAARKAEILPYLERLRAETGVPILYVSHNMAEVARLASHLVVLDDGRVLRTGPATQVLSDPALAPVIGVRDTGALIPAQVVAHAEDGVTELRCSGGPLYLPQIDAAPGTELRVRVLAQEVILARERPEGLSALNILPVEVLALRQGGGPGVMVQLRLGQDVLLARVTRRSAQALELSEGAQLWAVLKSLAVAHGDIAQGLAPAP
ncbi:MAG: molybdenum ABC transporter ATP-binding protein [Paracoccaceae bacterium]|nr:molybdenum ABC transporter ATP-binding protein [Paracoccaceae bacterium]